ncbi:ThiF family adenylyltransferase [Paenibacillus sp. GCM10023252]|uniref:ThiF family adenylyltransferase n=1 Tax=Paenibacillus sp. GCM10023252 TaxID=3252649 RepID=UPI00360C289D
MPDWPDRYSRQVRFAGIGEEGQAKLKASRVLVAGLGALGASLAQHMVRAGVGKVVIVDRDYVEPSNLQRQMLYDEEDALTSLPKAEAAARKLRRMNSEIEVVAHVLDINEWNAAELVGGVDLVLDGTDNAETRLLLSDSCYELGIPFLYGGVTGAQGMTAVLIPGETACLRCLIGGDEPKEDGDTCDTVGVISPAVELVASLQAAEALKLLCGRDGELRRTWLSIELWPFRMREMGMPVGNPSCEYCGRSAEERQRGSLAGGRERAERQYVGQAASRGDARVNLSDSSAVTASNRSGGQADTGSRTWSEGRGGADTVILCGRDSVQVTLPGALNLAELGSRLEKLGLPMTINPYLVRVELAAGERLVCFAEGRVLVQGTTDRQLAWELCERWLMMEEGESGNERLARLGAVRDYG